MSCSLTFYFTLQQGQKGGGGKRRGEQRGPGLITEMRERVKFPLRSSGGLSPETQHVRRGPLSLGPALKALEYSGGIPAVCPDLFLWHFSCVSADPIREGTAGSGTQETSNCGPWLRTAGQRSWGIEAVALQLPAGSGKSQPAAHRAEPQCLIGSVVLDPGGSPTNP